MKTNKQPIAKVYQHGESLYLHPFAFDPSDQYNKVLWFYSSEFQPMNLDDIFGYQHFPWIRFHAKNIWLNVKYWFRFNLTSYSWVRAWESLKKGEFRRAFYNVRSAVTPYTIYSIFPSYGVELAPVRLGLPYNLYVANDLNSYSRENSPAENSYVTPSGLHILMHLDWELEKIQAGTSTLMDFQQDDLLQFEVWKRKMYEHGYEVRFMCELDT